MGILNYLVGCEVELIRVENPYVRYRYVKRILETYFAGEY